MWLSFPKFPPQTFARYFSTVPDSTFPDCTFNQSPKLFTYAAMKPWNMETHLSWEKFALFSCLLSIFMLRKGRGVTTEMKIPSLCDVYPAFSHIRCRSVYNLPPHSSYSRMRAAWSQRLTADEREDRTAKMVMKQGKDGKRQEFPVGTLTTSRGPFCHPTTLAPPCPQLPVEKMCQRMFWVSHGKRPSEQITAFYQITARAFDVGRIWKRETRKFKDKYV